MGVKIDNPRNNSYQLYLAAQDNYGNFSQPLEININHPGIQKLQFSEQDITNLLASIKIKLPKVFSETSQEVWDTSSVSEEKDILGYRLFIQELDYDTEETIGEEEIIDYDAQELNEKGIIYYQSDTGKKYSIKVGAYDSVYHPDYNENLFNLTVSDSVVGETFKVNPPDISESLIKPNELTETLQGTGLTESDFGGSGIQDTYTLQAGVWDSVNNKPIVGGIGLAYNEQENDIDVQVVADRFRLFDPDIAPNGNALFAAGTVDGKSQIFMNANEIALTANDGNNEYADGNFFVLNDNNLRIYTEDFKLNQGTAQFTGEVQANQFSLTSGNMTINTDGISTNEFNLDSNTGGATFSGELQAASGSFAGNLQAATGRLGDNLNYIDFDGSNLSIKTDTFNLEKNGSIEILGKKNIEIVANDEEGYIKLEDEQGNYTILDERHLRFYNANSDDPIWYSKRVVYGTASSGAYIDLTNSQGEDTWETIPKVQTAISSIQTYYPSESNSDIYYECYATERSTSGFRVYGEAYAPIGEGAGFNKNYSSSYRFSNEYLTPNYTTIQDTTKIDVSLFIGQVLNGYYVTKWTAKVQYKTAASSSWSTMANFSGGGYEQNLYNGGTIFTNRSVSKIKLTPDRYNIRLLVSGMRSIGLGIKEYYYDYIEQGEVFYIAIEGGSFD